MSNQKTVYVLGAGFSAPAGGPDQAALLKRIFELPDDSPKTEICKEALRGFLENVLNVAPDYVDTISLEDIFTPIDRCLADGVSLRTASPEVLRDIRGKIEYLISLAIDRALETGTEAWQYVRDFASHLVKVAAIRARKASEGGGDATEAKAYDPFSIISLNWDIILDKCIYRELCMNDGGEEGDYSPIGVVDYCCYISSVEAGERRIRSGLWALGSGGYNVKLLKIHGSMNWLQCSNCQRLFVGFDEKINIPNYIDAKSCRHCQKYEVDAKLQGSIVMPTFLKDLSNFQIKLVWQNAGVEIMEADRIVFIGYSLPQADFEFRQLLSRMVSKRAEIHVVLYERDTPEGKESFKAECDRYRQFFSGHFPTFESGGVKVFVEGLKQTPV